MKEFDRGEILPLTGVRFIAVTMIFLFHYSYRIPFWSEFPSGIFNQLFLGVQVFFVLSGFVIAYKYFEPAETTKGFLSSYYLKRFAKIYPTFFVLTTLIFLVGNHSDIVEGFQWKIYFLNITFLKGLSPDYYLSGIGPTWSLTVEEMFYLFSPFIFVLIKRKNIFWIQVVFWWVVGAAYVLVLQFFVENVYDYLAGFVAFVTFFGRCFEFYLGIALALHISGIWHFSLLDRKFKFPFYTTIGLIGMGLMVIVISVICSWYGRPAVETIPGIFSTNILFPISVACFFFGLIRERSVVQKLLATRVFRILGESSYAFFLVHTGVIASGLEKYVSRNIVILFILLQVVSIIIYRFFERPVNLWIRRRRKTVAPATEPGRGV